MSNFHLHTRGIWVSDLDRFMYYPDADEPEDESAELDFREIALFDGRALHAFQLNDKGIDASEWRWAINQAETKLRNTESRNELEQDVIRALVLLGRPYAIARYAKWERIDFPSALTASLPLGLKALLSQYLSGQGLNRGQHFNGPIRDALIAAAAMTDVTAYRRTNVVQALIKQIASETVDHSGPKSLDREATRKILSLARLHFSVAELDFCSFADVKRLSGVYARARRDEEAAGKRDKAPGDRSIRNWRLRHLRPLSDLFPFAVRHGLERAARHQEVRGEVCREIALNELALAHCGVLIMRNTARGSKK